MIEEDDEAAKSKASEDKDTHKQVQEVIEIARGLAPFKDSTLEGSATLEDLDNAFASELLKLCERYQAKGKNIVSIVGNAATMNKVQGSLK